MGELTIGKAARAAGVNVETVRFYERRGLVQQPQKPFGAGARSYSADTVARIRFVKGAQQLGFSLREIGELLALRADPAADCARVCAQAEAKLKEVDRKIGKLQAIRGALEALVEACPRRGGLQTCSILEALEAQVPRQLTPPAPSATPEHPMKTLTFNIEGMHCESCAKAIKRVVERQPGVRAASVSFTDGEARLLIDPDTADEAHLAAAIEKPGYRVVACRASDSTEPAAGGPRA